MTAFEIINTFLSITAIALSIISFIKANNLSSVQNNIAMGELELTIRNHISQTKVKVTEITMEIMDIKSKENLTQSDKNKLNALQHIFYTNIEDNLNAYEEACAKYIDGKIDKERFKKTYYNEIRSLVENKQIKDKYFESVTSKYKCILKVYKEWFDLEN